MKFFVEFRAAVKLAIDCFAVFAFDLHIGFNSAMMYASRRVHEPLHVEK